MTAGASDAAYVPDSPGFAIFFLLKCGTPDQWVRATSVWGDFPVAADAIDTTGGVYKSLPMPIGLETLSQAINGAFQAVELTLSGVAITTEIVQLANVSRSLVNGARAHFGVMDLDARQQPVSSLDWMWRAIAGMPRISRFGKAPQAMRTITLPLTAAFKDRRLAPIAYLTPQGQRARSSDDGFCDRTPGYSAITSVTWQGE